MDVMPNDNFLERYAKRLLKSGENTNFISSLGGRSRLHAMIAKNNLIANLIASQNAMRRVHAIFSVHKNRIITFHNTVLDTFALKVAHLVGNRMVYREKWQSVEGYLNLFHREEAKELY